MREIGETRQCVRGFERFIEALICSKLWDRYCDSEKNKIVSALEDSTVYWCFNSYLYRQLDRIHSGLRKDKAAISVFRHKTCFRKEVTCEPAEKREIQFSK